MYSDMLQFSGFYDKEFFIFQVFLLKTHSLTNKKRKAHQVTAISTFYDLRILNLKPKPENQKPKNVDWQDQKFVSCFSHGFIPSGLIRN